MKDLLFINACVRQEKSRTYLIAAEAIKILKERYHVEEIDISEFQLPPVTKTIYENKALGINNHEARQLATKVAQAQKIVIAAPFWDMSFPAVLKIFFERVSLKGITFDDTQDGTIGLCRAEKILYITTRGMRIDDQSPLEQATPYLKALGDLWGIPSVITVSAYALDVCDEEEKQERINNAIACVRDKCKDF